MIDAQRHPTLAALFAAHPYANDESESNAMEIYMDLLRNDPAKLEDSEQNLKRQLSGEFPGYPTTLSKIDPDDVMEAQI